MKIAWYALAVRDLERAADYICAENPGAATKVEQRVRSCVESLSHFPASGRSGRVAGSRELIVPEFPYIVRYRVQGDTVQILRIFHTAREWRD